jgi:hypothetical protein
MEGLNLKSRATDDFKGFGMALKPVPLPGFAMII